MKYIELTADVLMAGVDTRAGTVLALADDDGAVGNILSAQRGREVTKEDFDAAQKAPPSKSVKAAA